MNTVSANKPDAASFKRPGGVSILSGPAGKFSASGDLRTKVCLLSDGTLLVSEGHFNVPAINNYRAILRKAGFAFREVLVPLRVIEETYRGGRTDMPSSGVSAAGAGTMSSAMHEMAKNLFQIAHKLRASDIHIVVNKVENSAKLWFRMDGSLEFMREETSLSGDALCRAIFQSLADVSETTFDEAVAQDARIGGGRNSKLPPGVDGIRIATGPLTSGYQMVLRLLSDMTSGNYNISALGYIPQQVERIRRTSHRPYGLALMSGPTGSGKSTTLMCVLNSLADENPGLNIISVEDPPEYKLKVRQMPVTNAKNSSERAEAFGAAIRAAVRLDPDVIMIGETRDKASADLALQAAATGHLVWTTVHANTAMLTVRRLLDLGAEPALVTDPAVVLLMACQRLVKVLCPDCSRPFLPLYQDKPEAFPDWDSLSRHFTPEETKGLRVVRDEHEYDEKASEFKRCKNPECKKGYVGRSVVAEVVVPDQHIMDLLRVGKTAEAVRYWKTERGGFSMEDHALLKVKAGQVDPFGLAELQTLMEDDGFIPSRQTNKIN